MIYIDSPIVLAELFSESKRPAAEVWTSALVTSRLTEYEVWNRAHAYGWANEAADSITALLDRLDFVELSPLVLARAKQPFAKPPRTLDALHLATCDYLVHAGQKVVLASFDQRMNESARAMGLRLHEDGLANG